MTGRTPRAILAMPGFRRLVGVRLASQLSDGVFQAALAGSLLFNPQRQTGALAIAVGFAVLLLPYSVIGPYVGVVLDRWSRRAVLVAANLLRAGLVLPTAVLIWTGRENAAYVLCALLIIGINRLVLAGLGAAAPHVVPAGRLVTANALAGTLGTVAYSAGLGVAAALLDTMLRKGFHGWAAVAGTAALGYAGAALLARASFGHDQLGPDEAERRIAAIGAELVGVFRGMAAGLRHLAARPVAAYAIGAQTLHRGLYGVLALATLLLYRHSFSGGDEGRALSGLAQVVIAGGLGSLAAAFLAPPASRRIGGAPWVAGLFGLVGIVVLALGLPFRPALLVIATFVVNICAQSTKIVVDTALQCHCDDEYRGRVFSVNDTTYNVSFVAGLFVAAVWLPADGRSSTAIVLVATGYLALAGWYALVSRPLTESAEAR